MVKIIFLEDVRFGKLYGKMNKNFEFRSHRQSINKVNMQILSPTKFNSQYPHSLYINFSKNIPLSA